MDKNLNILYTTAFLACRKMVSDIRIWEKKNDSFWFIKRMLSMNVWRTNDSDLGYQLSEAFYLPQHDSENHFYVRQHMAGTPAMEIIQSVSRSSWLIHFIIPFFLIILLPVFINFNLVLHYFTHLILKLE